MPSKKQPAPAKPDAILSAAAATAQPDQQPEVPPTEPAAEISNAATLPHSDAGPRPIFALADAWALLEVLPGQIHPHAEFEPENAIRAFKDEDGRTMVIVTTPNGLAKAQLQGAAQ
jgi:hypothetical protein